MLRNRRSSPAECLSHRARLDNLFPSNARRTRRLTSLLSYAPTHSFRPAKGEGRLGSRLSLDTSRLRLGRALDGEGEGDALAACTLVLRPRRAGDPRMGGAGGSRSSRPRRLGVVCAMVDARTRPG